VTLQEQHLAVFAQRVRTLHPRLLHAVPAVLAVGRLQTPPIARIAQSALTTVRTDLGA
jgi:hypothetical protein